MHSMMLAAVALTYLYVGGVRRIVGLVVVVALADWLLPFGR